MCDIHTSMVKKCLSINIGIKPKYNVILIQRLAIKDELQVKVK